MDVTVAAPVPPSQTNLSDQVSPKTTQSPARKKIVSTAQEALERAIAAAPSTPIKSSLPTPASQQIAAATTQLSAKNTIVTAQGTWQNVVTPSSPQKTLPAVKDFLQKAFETVQRQENMAAAQITLQKAITAHPSSKITLAMGQQSPNSKFVTTPLSPQSAIAAPFHSLPSVVGSAPAHTSVAVLESFLKAQTTAVASAQSHKSGAFQESFLKAQPTAVASAQAFKSGAVQESLLKAQPTAVASAQALQRGAVKETFLKSQSTAVASAQAPKSGAVQETFLKSQPTAVASGQAPKSGTVQEKNLKAQPTTEGSAESHKSGATQESFPKAQPAAVASAKSQKIGAVQESFPKAEPTAVASAKPQKIGAVQESFPKSQPTSVAFAKSHKSGAVQKSFPKAKPTAVASAQASKSGAVQEKALKAQITAEASAQPHKSGAVQEPFLKAQPNAESSGQAHTNVAVIRSFLKSQTTVTSSGQTHKGGAVQGSLQKVQPAAEASAQSHKSSAVKESLKAQPTAVASAQAPESGVVEEKNLKAQPTTAASAESHKSGAAQESFPKAQPTAVAFAKSHKSGAVQESFPKAQPTTVAFAKSHKSGAVQKSFPKAKPTAVASAQASKSGAVQEKVLKVQLTAEASAQPHKSGAVQESLKAQPTAVASGQAHTSAAVIRSFLKSQTTVASSGQTHKGGAVQESLQKVQPAAEASAQSHKNGTVQKSLPKSQPAALASSQDHKSVAESLLTVQSTAKTSAQAHESVAVQETVPKAQPAALSIPDKSIANEALEQPNVTKNKEHISASEMAQTSDTGQAKKAFKSETGTISKVGQTGHSPYTNYDTAWPANPKPRQTENSSQKRAVLVAKRRHSPSMPNTEENSKTDLASEDAQTDQSSSVSENSSTTHTPETKEAKFVISSEKPQSAQTVASSEDSPIKHGTSRVVQTYLTYKNAQQNRAQNGPQTSTQTAKKSDAQDPQSDANASGSARSGFGRRPPPTEDDEIDPKRRVLVSGFPPYTQPQDLMRVLSKFGTCQVDKCRNRLAVVTFATELEAKSAIKATDELCIYGDFIEIKPFTNPRHVEELFRAYKKVISTEKGQDIIMPNKIDLSGDFYQQLENIQNAIRLTREQVQAITNLYLDLEMVLQQEWPGCVAIPFGSIPTGLGIKSSDADCYVEVPAALRARGAGGGAAAFVTRARRLLAFYPRTFTQLVAIPRANTPIVKFRHVPSGFHCDVSAKTPLGAQNSKLIKLLLEHDPRLAHVAVLVKYWAKVHELSGTGRLTNYALTMMVVFYLQQPHVALVPAVERLQREPASSFIVDHWNAGFAPRLLAGVPNPVTLPELLGGFFEFYAKFDFDELVVCPYLGVAVRKAAFDAPSELPPQFARYVANVLENLASPIRHATPFCVQDPFEQSHNVASSVSPRLAYDIRAYFKFAADTYIADRVTGCRNYLRTVLLTRPRLRRERTTPTTKIFLIPRVRGEIVDADWRGRAREIILEMIFEKMMKLKLKRETEKEERERREEEEMAESEKRPKERRGLAKIDREKYSGAATKPVWRRRKNYSANVPESALTLISRQATLTEEILAANAQAPLEFEMELGFRDEPRHFYVFFKLVSGELDVFRQFVAFVHTAMFDWFKILVRPYLAPQKETTGEATKVDSKGSAARRDCTVEFEPDPEPVRPALDPADITRDLDAVSLADDADTDSTDSSKRDPPDAP